MAVNALTATSITLAYSSSNSTKFAATLLAAAKFALNSGMAELPDGVTWEASTNAQKAALLDKAILLTVKGWADQQHIIDGEAAGRLAAIASAGDLELT